MRITNNIIMHKAGTNINGTKLIVDKENTQMTTQKAIDRPSDDPVIAVRSLRLSTQLSKINQYYEKNIPDAESWMDVTESALKNMQEIVKDVHSLSIQGRNDPLTAENRQTILSQLQALQKQLYAEGNADSAGRTVFTGYRTNKNLTFPNPDETVEDLKKVSYNIRQTFDAKNDMDEYRYYSHEVTVPATDADIKATDKIPKVEKSTYTRIRLAYNDITSVKTDGVGDDPDPEQYLVNGAKKKDGTLVSDGKDYTKDDGDTFKLHYEGTDPNSSTPGDAKISGDIDVKTYADEDAWLHASTSDPKKKTVGDGDVIMIRSTGELIFGDEIASKLKSEDAKLDIVYNKTGFNEGELRPEYYYNCSDVTDPQNRVDYKKYEADGTKRTYDIEYTVAANQNLAVNLEADEVFDSSMIQDVDDMISVVTNAINAHDKVDRIDAMMKEDRYASVKDQLTQWREAAQREADFADDQMGKVYSRNIGRSDAYLDEISLAHTKLGCKGDQLDMTKARMSDQQETVEELQSKNDDVDLSEIVLKYVAAHTAYQASLTAAGRLGKMSLLNYI